MDAVRQSVWIADSLIAQYTSVMNRYMAAWKDENDPEMAVLRAEIERVYPSIWEHLDAAAAQSKQAGRQVDAFTAIRTRPGLEVTAAIADVHEQIVDAEHGFSSDMRELNIRHNAEGVAAAGEASEALRSSWPELDWTPPAEPDVDLRPRGVFSRLFGKKR